MRVKKYYAMWTTISDSTKKTFRKEIKTMVNSEFHDAIDQGACDYLYSCSSLDPSDVLKAISESEIREI